MPRPRRSVFRFALAVLSAPMCFVILAVFARDLLAQELPASLTPVETGQVVEIVDGDTIVLADGRQVRLVGLQAPKLALGRSGFVDWPLAEESQAFLEDLALNRSVALAFGGLPEDRHGRLLAHLVRDDGVWLQGAILAAGMARVYSFADNRTAVADMLALEQTARATEQGIWALSHYAIRAATEPLEEAVDSFQVIEGRVLDAAEVRGRYFLNFGEDYRTDFTVTVSPSDARAFSDPQSDLLGLEGQQIRVRGWVGFRNGPQIEADHPEQIEIIGP
ncbi:MAG: thermonuclease family protein [Pseudomonadota bacterium]